MPILRMEVLGGERGRCCCRGGGRLEVHVATGAGLFGPRRAAAPRRVPVHASTLTASHFPTEGRGEEEGEGGRGKVRGGQVAKGKRSRKRKEGNECVESEDNGRRI